MQDYFKEFIIEPRYSRLGKTPSSSTSLKTHLVWALLAGSGILLSWNASKRFTKYKLAKPVKKPKKSKS